MKTADTTAPPSPPRGNQMNPGFPPIKKRPHFAAALGIFVSFFVRALSQLTVSAAPLEYTVP